MQELVEAIAGLLADDPDLTPYELFDYLRADRQDVRSARALESVLRLNSDRFTRSERGWVLQPAGQDDRPPVKTTEPEHPAPLAAPTAPVEDIELERELRERLAGRRLIAEIGLDATTHERVRNALELVLSRSGQNASRAAQTNPCTLVTYLVGHGIYHYEAGSFWPSVTIDKIDISAGRAFKQALTHLGLESFDDLVTGDNAQEYLGRILAHGGIPKYCLDDFFTLLLRDIERSGGDAQDLLALWRTRKTAFLNIDKPVRRFLLYGGGLAVDLLDRCIDLVREHQRTGTLLKPDEVGLPPYVVNAYRKHEGKPRSSNRQLRRLARPRILLDPWSASGPELELPPVPHDLMGATWHVSAERMLERENASHHKARVINLHPAKSWHVELHHGSRTERDLTFEGLDRVAALFFSVGDGTLLPPSSGISAESVWVLTPPDSIVNGISADGEQCAPTVLEELPPPSGPWSGFELRCLSLEGLRALAVSSNDDERRVSVRPPAARPQLSTMPVEHVVTDEGVAVYSAFPELVLPAGDDLDPALWQIRLQSAGTWEHLAVADLIAGEHGWRLDREADASTIQVIDLVVQGPLGSDLRTSFVVVPGLEVTRPDRILFPGERAASIRVSAHNHAVNGEHSPGPIAIPVPDDHDEVAFEIDDGSGSTIRLIARVARLLWGPWWPGRSPERLSARRIPFTADDLLDENAPAITIRTGAPELPLQLRLSAHGELLQTSEEVRSGRGGGRWVFHLAPFRDVIRQSDASSFELELLVGHRPVGVASIRPSLNVEQIQATARVSDDFTAVHLEFEETRPLRDRVARLWSEDRPWEPPIVEPIPDDVRGVVEISGYERIPAGHYLAELTVDDGWVAPQRPDPSAANIIGVQVGDSVQINDRLDRLAHADPFAVLEFAHLSGRIFREFDDDELEKILPATVETAIHRLRSDEVPDFGSMQLRALCSLILARVSLLPRACIAAVEDGRCDERDLLLLTIALGPRLQAISPEHLDESAIRGLWGVAPALAASLDVGRNPDTARAERAEEFLGWRPAEGPDSVVETTHIEQVWVGIDGDQLRAIQRSIELVPKRVLSHDALILANFEWLLAEKTGDIDLEGWWRQNKSILHRFDPEASETRQHFEALAPPPGTFEWARFPQLPMAAASMLLSDADSSPESARLLADAMTFAPLLVSRTLVLTKVLSRSTESEPGEP